MIHKIKSLCQITENSSNIHSWLTDLNILSVSMKGASSVDIHFLKPYCSITSMLFVCRCCLNLLKSTGYVMHQQFLTFNNCTFCPHCIYVFCIYLRTNSNLCHLQCKLIGFYNRDEKCLLCGTKWVFK